MVSKRNTDIQNSDLDSTKMYHPELMRNKVCLITGGSNGGMLKQIGQAYLQHGAKAVILFSRNEQKNNAVAQDLSQFGTCVGISGDVRKPESCQSCVAKIIEQFGRLDVLVNGAAGNFLATAEKLSSKGFQTVIEIDTVGTFNMSQAAFRGYMKKNGGVIVNISASLHWNGSVFQVHSASAKAGVDAVTKVLACEWGPYGVRVNGLVPGGIEGTEGMARLSDFGNLNDKKASKNALKNSEAKKVQGDLSYIIPSQRLGKTQDIANMALFMSSNASHYVNGATLVCDGGSYLTMPNYAFSQPSFVKAWSAAKL